MRRRHRQYYAALAGQAEGAIGTADEDVWWGWLGVEYANLRAALSSGLRAGDIASAVRLAAALGWFWYTRGHSGAEAGEVERILEQVDAVPAGRPLRRRRRSARWSSPPRCSPGGGVTLYRAEAMLRRSQGLARRQGDSRRCALSHAFLGHVARRAGRYDAARHEHATAARLYRLDSATSRAWPGPGTTWAWSLWSRTGSTRRGSCSTGPSRSSSTSTIRGRRPGPGWGSAGVALRHGDWTTAARELALATTSYRRRRRPHPGRAVRRGAGLRRAGDRTGRGRPPVARRRHLAARRARIGRHGCPRRATSRNGRRGCSAPQRRGG